MVDFERSRRSVSSDAIDAMRIALEAAGVEFIPENGGGAGVRLRKSASASDGEPKPVGPATDVVDAMDAAIEGDKAKRARARRGKADG